MTPITATVRVADRDITVREITMQEIRRLLGFDEVAPPPEPVVPTDADNVSPGDWMALFVRRRLAIDGVNLAYVHAITDLTEADYDRALPSQLGELVAKVRQLNPFFFELLQSLAGSRGSSHVPPTPAPPSPEPSLSAPSAD